MAEPELDEFQYPSHWGEIGVYSKTQSQEKQDNEVKRILGKRGYDVLHENTTYPPTDSARRAFAAYLAKTLAKLPNAQKINEETIFVEDFLGPIGINLYQKAIEEERNSKEFKNAVFLASFKHYPGVKWDKTKIIHVGGPSGSGKSYACDAVIRQLSSERGETENQSGNDVVLVDGGIDREVSQMRSILLGGILSKGFRGGEDLHSKSKRTAIKRLIKKAALASENNLSLAIPETFTNPKHIYKFREFIVANKEQIFVSVEADRAQTAVSANARAWRRGSLPFKEQDLKFNVRHASESKKYDPEYFRLGENLTKAARYVFENLIGGRVFVLKNDVLYLKKDESDPLGYKICNETDSDFDVRTTRRVYEAWLNHVAHYPDLRFTLEEWTEQVYLEKDFQSGKWEPCYLEEYKRAKPNERLKMPRYQYILWEETQKEEDLKHWAALKAKEFGPKMTEKAQRRLTRNERRHTLSERREEPSNRKRTETKRRTSTRYFENIRERTSSQTKLVTVPEVSLRTLAQKLEKTEMQKKYRIKNIDSTQLDAFSSHLKVDMFCNDEKAKTKKVYLEKANVQGGIKYSMERPDEEEQNLKMIKQIIQLAVDNAKPGAEILIHPSPNQEMVKKVLEEALKKKFTHQFVLENNKYRILSPRSSK